MSENQMVVAEDAKAKLQVRQNILSLIASRFQLGVHYYEIKGKKSLSKGGAEEYCCWMGLLSHIDHDKETRELCGNPEGWLFMRCELVANGNQVGVGRGSFCIRDAQGDFNKAVKMCQKRAYVDATLRVGGLTAIGFTQDLEDEAPSPTREPERQITTPSTTTAPAVPATWTTTEAHEAGATVVPQAGIVKRVVDTPFQKAKRKAKLIEVETVGEVVTKQKPNGSVPLEVVKKIVKETEDERRVRMNNEAEKVFGDAEGAVVFESKSGDTALASPMEWRRCAIVARESGLDDATRRSLCMSKVAELRGVTVESLGSWDECKGTVTMEEIEQVTVWFRKGV